MNFILTHPTLIMKASVLTDYAIHHGMARLIEVMMMVLGGV